MGREDVAGGRWRGPGLAGTVIPRRSLRRAASVLPKGRVGGSAWKRGAERPCTWGRPRAALLLPAGSARPVGDGASEGRCVPTGTSPVPFACSGLQNSAASLSGPRWSDGVKENTVGGGRAVGDLGALRKNVRSLCFRPGGQPEGR